MATLSVVIPARPDEPPEWIEDLSAKARLEADEVLIETGGPTKADALNRGLLDASNPLVIFIDSDVILRGGEITTTHAMLDRGAEFVGAPYGRRPPPFPIFAYTSGWFFGARRDVFLALGGWVRHYVEDVATIQGIKRAGHRVWLAPFSVELRRAPRNPLMKFAASLFA